MIRLSIYLGDDCIYTALAKTDERLCVREYEAIRLKPGSLPGGLLADQELIMKEFKLIAERYRKFRSHVHLTIGGNQAATKVVRVPFMKEKHLLRLCEKELRGYGSLHEEMVYDYSVVSTKNKDGAGSTILCAALRRQVLDGYLELLGESGLTVDTLGTALDALVHLPEIFPCVRSGACIAAVMEGDSIVSCLYTDGAFRCSSRTPLGPSHTAPELARDILSVLQFYHGRGAGHKDCRLFLSSAIPGAAELGSFLGLTPEELVLPHGCRLMDGFSLEEEIYTAWGLAGRSGWRWIE